MQILDLKEAAENRKEIDPNTGKKKRSRFQSSKPLVAPEDSNTGEGRRAGSSLGAEVNFSIKVEDAMLKQGSGGAYEVANGCHDWLECYCRVDNFVFEQAAERYALDEDVAKKIAALKP
jgi:magnesium chelatase subunit H